ncbi:ankyrin-1-like [Trichogramma pretiosum]|uniref:ankyrin-1-like n=1 Tax=Trichogramma pretiosum TaxID=7493 RepID=UPI000C71BA47|nr:ankyrin-1-like [Trichogramma pretiosum]
MTEDDRNCIKKLKIMRGEVNWEINNERRKFLNQFYTLIENWEGQLPNLPDIFQSKEIDWLLKQHVKIMCKTQVILKKSLLLDFVIRCGYKDQPKVDDDDSPLLRRTTPIHIVARHKYSLLLHYITRDLFKIYDRFDVNYYDEESFYTHFHVACEYGCDEVVEKFLEFGQDPNCISEESDTCSVNSPMYLALVNSHKQVVRLLLRFGADPNLTDAEGSTPLHLICDHCDDDFMEMFFKINEDMHRTLQVDALDNRGWAPLHLALDRRLKKKTELLLSRGASPNLVNEDGKSPLHIILCKKDRKVKKYFKGYSSYTDDSDDSDDEHESHDVDDYELMKAFFKTCDEKNQTVHVDARDDLGRTPLHLVVRDKNMQLVELLLRRGANPNLTKSGGLTVLHIICRDGKDADKDDYNDNYYVDDDLVELFFLITDEMQLSVKVNAVDDLGNAPLHYALGSDARKVIELLLSNGADPNLADAEGLTPLHIISKGVKGCYYSCGRYFLEVFFEVIKQKHLLVQVDALDKEGNTPLHLALKNYNKDSNDNENIKEVIKLLLENGANLNLVDAKGSTPLHIICNKEVRYNDEDDHRHDLLRMFFEVSNVKNQPIQVDAFDKEGSTPLHLALNRNIADRTIVTLLLRNGANPNLADAKGSTALHMICHLYKDRDEFAKMFFDISDENHLTVHIDAQDNWGRTPLHVSLDYVNTDMAEFLLKRGADPHLASSDGSTILHRICGRSTEDYYFVNRFFAILDEKRVTVQIDARDKFGRTPLHLALARNHKKSAKLLLRRGANPNLANAKGLTPLHTICKDNHDDDDLDDEDDVDGDNNGLAKSFFRINDEIQQTVQIDAIDRMGRTPLHFAVEYGYGVMTKLLLRKGANPNWADANGLTPLHVICKRDNEMDDELLKLFFKINDDMEQTVQVNAQDSNGNTPLHMSLGLSKKKSTELLLRRGADQNLANEDGSTPLHIICQTKDDDDLTKTYIKVNDDIQPTLQVDAVDKMGRTPLQWAVANLKTNVVEVLLNHRADLSDFVFPTENYFAENYRPRRGVWSAVFDTMSIIKSLQGRGFKLDQNTALTIMKFFAKHGLITDQCVDIDECLRSNQYIAREAKRRMVTPILSFYDFLCLPYEEAEKIFTLKDYEEFTSGIFDFNYNPHQAYTLFLCQRITTRFFQRWALEFFMPLTRYRLPILCCDIIIRQMKLKDLWSICLAATGQNLDGVEQSFKPLCIN